VVQQHGDGRHEYAFHLDGTSLVDVSPGELPVLPQRAWALHVGTLALAVDPPAATYETLVHREAGRRQIIIDPNVRPAMFGAVDVYRHRFERLAHLADVVKLSEDDAQWLYPGRSAGEVVQLILDFGPGIVAVTRGEHGAVAGSNEACVDVPGIPVAVADTVGAGDSFGAALMAALVDEGAFGPESTRAADADVLSRAVSYAVAASAITCTRTGAVPPSRLEIETQLCREELAPEGS
jgi:fructokinase